MNTMTTSRLAHWWIHSLNTATTSRPLRRERKARADALSASDEQARVSIAARLVRAVQHWLERLARPDEPQNAAELLAYARSIERDMPGLAADLRFAALRHVEASA
jgi:hypothetical protein